MYELIGVTYNNLDMVKLNIGPNCRFLKT